VEFKRTDTLAKLRGRSVEVATRKKQILDSEEMKEAKLSLSQLQQKIEALRVRKVNVETDENFKESQIQELMERAINLKKAIGANVQSFMGQQIQLQ